MEAPAGYHRDIHVVGRDPSECHNLNRPSYGGWQHKGDHQDDGVWACDLFPLGLFSTTNCLLGGSQSSQ